MGVLAMPGIKVSMGDWPGDYGDVTNLGAFPEVVGDDVPEDMRLPGTRLRLRFPLDEAADLMAFAGLIASAPGFKSCNTQ